MKLDDLTLGDARQLFSIMGGKPEEKGPWEIGTAYLIRAVTMYYTGRLISVSQQELVLEDAAWIADTGRYSDALKTGKLNEVEPIIGPVIIGRGSIIDGVKWPNNIPLPREQK